uniref:Putative crossover junction endonuclease eme1 n=1 Tax=Aedes aegypti TaxID=7159 RepID=A0A0P6JSN9_AEDAE
MSKRSGKQSENLVERLKRTNYYNEQRNLKPGHCNKFLHACIDPQFLQGEHGAEVLSKLNALNLKYEIKQQLMPRVITFYRTSQQNLTPQGTMTEKNVDQKFMIFLISGEELVRRVKGKNLLALVQQLQDLYPGKSVYLLVFGLITYCRNHRGCVGRRETEIALTEVQLFADCSHQLIESAEEVGNFVAQLGKSLAELPYKQQQNEKYNQEQLYLGNEKKGCVRVEGSAGLHQLYQNQLVKIPSVTLEIAEAIIAEYPTLSKLIEGFRMNGPSLLATIPIRRAGGPITSSVRRIGPELSKKLCTIYSSLDPKQKL